MSVDRDEHSEHTPEPNPTESFVEDLIAQVLERRESGDDALDEFCERYPACADQLREGVADLEALGFLAPIADAPTPPDRPTSVGRYPIHGELGRGGMGVVYLARDPRLGRWLAVKRLPAQFARQPDALARFEREAQLLAALDHPNVAAIHSLEDDDDGPFLTLALVRGDTLADRLADGPRSIDESYSILRQVALALEAAHEAAIVHRDLKPQNIMIDDRDRVQVLDFGLAKAIGSAEVDDAAATATTDGDVFESRAGLLVGTPGYMSPEQIRGESVDARTDLFAWGCIAFECLTGRAAFGGEAATERFDRTLAGEVDLSSVPSEVDRAVVEVLERSLALDRDRRPADVVEVRRVIDDAVARRSRGASGGERRRVGNLPEPWTRFIGRSSLVRSAASELSHARLVTLVGPGGAGKTRLSIEVARRHVEASSSVVPWWVDLSALTDADLVVASVARVIASRDVPGADPIDGLVAAIGDRESLLIFDNCEHLLAATSQVVARLLAACPSLRILATSRESFGVVGETVVRVTPLELPTVEASRRGWAAVRDNDAVALFEERARAARPDLVLSDTEAGDVVEICRRVDGLPLAIELAAARLAAMSIVDLAARLAHRLHWLTGRDASRQPRQRALRSLVDWSHELLEGRARVLYRRMSVFAGGATLEALEAVCADDDLRSWDVLDLVGDLVEKSLVELDSSGERARYRMLETLREFAEERLRDSDEREAIERRHLEYYVTFAEGLAPTLAGADQADGFARLEEERDNLRVAIGRAASGGDPELGARVLGATWRFYNVRGHWTEGRRLAEQLLDVCTEANTSQEERARTMRCAGFLAMQQGDYDEAELRLASGLELERTIGDRGRIAASVSGLAQLALRRGRHSDAKEHFVEHLSLARELGQESSVAMTLAMLGNVAQLEGDRESARPYFEESLVLSERLGNRYLTAGTLHNLADIMVMDADVEAARELLLRALELNRELGNRPWEARNLTSLGLAAKFAGDFADARRYYAESVQIHRDLGDKEGLRDAVLYFGMLAAAVGQHRRALRLLAAAEAYSESRGLRIAIGPQTRLDSTKAEVEVSLDPDDYRDARAAGAKMSIDEALEYALGE